MTGIVTGVGVTVNPYIEYYADNLPERRLGVFGIGLILCDAKRKRPGVVHVMDEGATDEGGGDVRLT